MKEAMNRYKYLLVAGTVCLAACSTQLENPGETEDVATITFEVPALRYDGGGPETRVALYPAVSGPDLRWEAADRVGIFPDSGAQISFSMASGAGATVATFDGGGWSLRQNARYYSYYPYVDDTYLDAREIPVSFTGQHQTGLSSYNGLSHYMVSDGTTSSNGSLHFSYTLLNAVLCLDLTLPTGTYTKVSVTAGEPAFLKEGHYDLTSPVLVGDRYTRTLEVALDQFVVTSSSAVQVYLSCPPVDLTGKDVTVKVFASDGETYECVKTPSSSFQAGHIYRWNCLLDNSVLPAGYYDKEDIWSWNGAAIASIPEYASGQYAATAAEAADPSFKWQEHTRPYLLWHDRPSVPNGTCAILVAGEDYNDAPDTRITDYWGQELTKRGVQCVTLVYRVPRQSSHYCRSAWFDLMRAVRVIHCEALYPSLFDRRIDGSKIGVVGFGAGGHLALAMAASSLTTGLYPAQDDVDRAVTTNSPLLTILNWAIVHSPAYVTTDSNGTLPIRDGYGPDVTVDPVCFQFDAGTCPTCLIHGQDDPYTPMGSTQFYRRLRQTPSYLWASPAHVPGEVHLYPDKGHEVFGFERGVEFLAQMGFLEPLQAEVGILNRYSSDADCRSTRTENVWPSTAQIPNYQRAQSIPNITWYFPRVQKTKAIQIIYSCGSYEASDPMGFDVASARRYLNAKGMTVVTLNYRVPRPSGLVKHLSAWQDLQRTIRIVRSEAASFGLDPDRIGIMGASAGGHLTIMGATSSRHRAYNPIDALDEISCKVQWGVASCPAYVLTDGIDSSNSQGGNTDDAILVPEFSFDLDTPPMLFLHGDDDSISAMGSVKVWEKLRSMGIPAEVHTYALGIHQFQQSASPGTGRYYWLDRVGEFVEQYW